MLFSSNVNLWMNLSPYLFIKLLILFFLNEFRHIWQRSATTAYLLSTIEIPVLSYMHWILLLHRRTLSTICKSSSHESILWVFDWKKRNEIDRWVNSMPFLQHWSIGNRICIIDFCSCEYFQEEKKNAREKLLSKWNWFASFLFSMIEDPLSNLQWAIYIRVYLVFVSVSFILVSGQPKFSSFHLISTK